MVDGGFYWESLWNTTCNIYRKCYTLENKNSTFKNESYQNTYMYNKRLFKDVQCSLDYNNEKLEKMEESPSDLFLINESENIYVHVKN